MFSHLHSICQFFLLEVQTNSLVYVFAFATRYMLYIHICRGLMAYSCYLCSFTYPWKKHEIYLRGFSWSPFENISTLWKSWQPILAVKMPWKDHEKIQKFSWSMNICIFTGYSWAMKIMNPLKTHYIWNHEKPGFIFMT